MALPIDVRNAISKQAPKLLKSQLMSIARSEVEKIKRDLISDFLDHPVTRELLDGPNAKNISGTLGGKGNLFTFIGFDESYKPIKPILQLFESITVIFGGYTKDGIEADVTIPTAEEVFAITPLPWAEGRSWAKGIESGLSGLGRYLVKNIKSSRSGGAIQSASKIESGVRFKNTPYISAILKKYKKILIIDETFVPA